MADPTVKQEDWDSVAAEREQGTAPPAAQDTPKEDPPQDPAPQAQESSPEPNAVEADPYANLSPEVQAKLKRFDDMAAVMPSLVNELRETKGRVGALQSQWAKSQQTPAEKPTETQVKHAVKDPEKWEALKKDFPEWGEAISEFVSARTGSSAAASGPSAEEIQRMVASGTGEAISLLKQSFEKKLVEVVHPGWSDEVKTPEFGTWMAAQPTEVHTLFASDDGLDAIRALNLYKSHKAAAKRAAPDNRQQRLAAAAETPRGNTQPIQAKSFEELTPEERWNYLAREREKNAG